MPVKVTFDETSVDFVIDLLGLEYTDDDPFLRDKKTGYYLRTYEGDLVVKENFGGMYHHYAIKNNIVDLIRVKLLVDNDDQNANKK